VLRNVDLGVWRPPAPDPATSERDPLFHEFASDWFAAKQPELAPNTARNYRNDRPLRQWATRRSRCSSSTP
jgi:hypothetical protein